MSADDARPEFTPTINGVRRDLAPIGRRAVAELIDVAIISAILIGLAIIAAVFLTGAAAGGDAGAYVTLSVVFGLVYAILALGWLVLLSAWHSRGGSPGQRAMGIGLRRRAGGGHLTFGAALGRILIFRLLAAVIVGYFTPLFDGTGNRQGWHDKVVDAIMIDTRVTSPAPAAPTPATYSVPPLPAPPVLSGSGILAPSSPLPPVLPVATASTGQDAGTPPLPPLPFPSPGVAPASGVPIPSGLVSEVPGVVRAPQPSPSSPPPPAQATAPAPVPEASAPVAIARPAATELGGDIDADIDGDEADVDATRHVAPRRAAGVVVVWDDGVANAVTSSAVFGRNPDAVDGGELYAVPDATRSLSKTHFELVVDDAGVWIIDRHSTNGTAIATPDGRRAAPAGERVRVNVGDTVLIGDRSFTLRASA